MPTDRITSTSALIETLQAMARERPTGVRHGSGSKPTTGTATRYDVAALRRRLRDVVTDMDTNDPESFLSTRNATVREILLWEFGNEFRNDSQFSPMIDAIGKALDADPALGKQLADLVESLRRA